MPVSAITGATAKEQRLAKQMAQAQLAREAGQTQGMAPQGLVSPYDGTTPTMGLAGTLPTMGGIGGVGPGGQRQPGSAPQMNATNQSALASNGDVNQTVTNQNHYTAKYYNLVIPNGYGSSYGGWNPLSGLGSQGNSFIDPQTGVLYVQEERGFMGWLKRLFKGY